MKKNKKPKLKARVVFEWEYEADPELYNPLSSEEVTINDMIKIDRNSFDDDPWLFIDCCKNSPTLELVEVKSEDA